MTINSGYEAILFENMSEGRYHLKWQKKSKAIETDFGFDIDGMAIYRN